MNVTQKPPMSIGAWLYPDKNYDATSEITDGRHIDILKSEYYHLNDDGTLQQLTTGYNAYSAANVALIKQHSTQQFVTISGSTAGMNALATNRNLTSAFLSTMYSFLQSSGFTGIELDFEGFGDWTPQQYANYKSLVAVIGNAMHAIKCKLIIDGPAISDNAYQGYYLWKWEDFDVKANPALANAIDGLVVMAYDEQDDQGAGTPVSSLSWLNNICQWMLNKITDHSKIVVGIPSYGYTAKTGAYAVTQINYQQATQLPGFNTAKRDASSGEMMWTQGSGANSISNNYSDSTTIQGKLNVVQNSGINAVSVWALPGNLWFPQQTPQPTPTPPPVPTPQPATITLTSDQIKAIAGALSSDQITTIKNIAG